jgi:3-ketosteroid 9alpha-hydroxylase-like protein
VSVSERDVGLDPRPIGWFAIGRSGELPRGGERRGTLCAAPYRVRRRGDGSLHGKGSAVAVADQNGFLLAWHHPDGAPPAWRVPLLDERGWRPLRHRLLHARTHPQEVYENSIDVGHFPVIHGYQDISVLRPMRLAGHEMDVSYEIARQMPGPLPAAWRRMVARFEVHLHGLGCAHNHIEVPTFGIAVRMFALATPTEPGHVEIRLGVSVARASRLPRPLGWLAMPLVHAGVKQSIVNDFLQDMAVWEHKRYLRPPLLVKGDGPIEGFRRWSRQFYGGAA